MLKIIRRISYRKLQDFRTSLCEVKCTFKVITLRDHFMNKSDHKILVQFYEPGNPNSQRKKEIFK